MLSVAEGTAGLWIAVAIFGLAILLLDWFDVSLPRGDSFGVSGALIASGFVVFDSPSPAFIGLMAMVSVALVHGMRVRASGVLPLWASISIRVSALVGLWSVLGLIDLSGIALHESVVAVVAAGAYLGFELTATQTLLAGTSGRPFGRLLRGNMRRQTPIIAAQVSVAALVVVTYGSMGVYVLVPVVAVLLLIRQSYAVLLQMRETYRATVAVMVEAAEGQDVRLMGHADRTAQITREICMRLGMNAAHVERASYAALLHDVDAIALSDTEREADSLGSSSLVMQDVAFLADVLPVLRICDGREPVGTARDVDLTIAMTVALAGEIDAMRSDPVVRAHHGNVLERVSEQASGAVKARVVSAALELCFEIPAVS